MNASIGALFHPFIAQWFTEKYGEPTDAQAASWPAIAEGRNILVSAPTGSGKTLTAFMSAVDSLAKRRWEGYGIKILYVSPLKALNNDVRKNLLEPLEEIAALFAKNGDRSLPEIRVMTRSGDTPSGERQKMIRSPPDILITTPESLNLMLTSRSGKSMLSSIKAVILDEIHALSGSKRGTHLISAIERLTVDSGEFQRIGLSATAHPLETIAAWMGGLRLERGLKTARPVTIVRSSDKRDITLTVRSIDPGGVASPCASLPDPRGTPGRERDSWWEALARDLVGIIRENRSTLIFTNSRRMTEKIARFVNESSGELLAYPHHGSLSRELRLNVEQRLKAGELRAIVATSSLELGIDIGSLDKVVMIQTPFSVSGALQRIGRAGHRVGGTSSADLIPIHGLDTVYAAVLADLVKKREIEKTLPVENPLDILAQVLISMLSRDEWDVDALYEFITCMWPYRNLPREFFDLTLSMLAGRYADSPIRELRARVAVDPVAGTAKAKDGSDFLIYRSGGTIPDRGYFQLRLAGDKALIGELDEEFVWERNLGDQFSLGSGAWQITAITQSDVEVRPADPTRATIPFWKAEDSNRDFHLSAAVACFLEYADSRLDDPGFTDELRTAYALDPHTAEGLHRFLSLQASVTHRRLPGRHRILVEDIRTSNRGGKGSGLPQTTQLVIHTFWGGRLNKPFALALAAAWEKRHGSRLEFFAGNESILLEFPETCGNGEGPNHRELLTALVSSANLESLLRERLESSGLFGARFRENSGRALLLPRGDSRKRFPLWLNRLRSRKLLDAVMRYPDFPMILETWRECLEDDFDIDNLKRVVDELAAGTIAVESCVSAEPSPFAEGVAWRQTNLYMYKDDTPESGAVSGMTDDIFEELLSDSRLRPAIMPLLAEELTAKLERTFPGYRPENAEDLVSILNEAAFMSLELWDELSSGPFRETKPSGAEFDVSRYICKLRPANAETDWVVSTASLPFVLSGLGFSPGSSPEGLPPEIREWIFKTARPDEETAAAGEAILSAWLSRRGPVSLPEITAFFGWPEIVCLERLESLAAERELVSGKLLLNSEETLFCDGENYERLLRKQRQARRAEIQPLAAEDLAPFLADRHGAISRGSSIEALKDCLDMLFGYPLPAELWESAVFPTRLEAFHPAWLDSLFSNSNLAWYGAGSGKTAFSLDAELGLFLGAATAIPDDRERRFLDSLEPISGADIIDVARSTGESTAETSASAWACAWKGLATTEGYEAVRNGIASGFKASPLPSSGKRPSRDGFSRWERSRPLSARWFRIVRRDEGDAIEASEAEKELAGQLLRRYGIVFRDILRQEPSAFRWGRMFKALRLMELSGEVVAGRFISGFEGIQFASPQAAARLREMAADPGMFDGRVWWLNACDPASLCAIAGREADTDGHTDLEGRVTLPRRIATNWIVYLGKRLVMTVRKNGREIDISPEPGDLSLGRILAFFGFLLSRPGDPRHSVSIDLVNGMPSIESPYKADFLAAGFSEDYRSLTLWKKYRTAL